MEHPQHPFHPAAIGWAEALADGTLVKAFAGIGHEHAILGADFIVNNTRPAAELLISQAAMRGIKIENYDFFVSIELIPKREAKPESAGGTD